MKYKKPIKSFKVAGRKINVYDKKNVPSKKFLTKVLKKMPDDTRIPLEFMNRKTYLKNYIVSQEKKHKVDFTPKQEQKYIKSEMKEYNNIAARYTTRENPYKKPAVVFFNDNPMSKQDFKFTLAHEEAHRSLENQGKSMGGIKEEIYCDNVAKSYVSKDYTSKNTRKVKCKKCNKLYPSIVEDDYSDYCGDCQEKFDKQGFKFLINDKFSNNKFLVYDPQEKRVMGTYSNVKRARNKADKLDNEYGAYRYKVIDEDKFSNNRYENELQEFIQKPCTDKGLGRCGDAAQATVNAAIRDKVPDEKIKVWGVQRKHPFKEGLSNHVIAEVEGKFYDPTRTQYGKYDSHEFDKMPSEYGNKVPLNLNFYKSAANPLSSIENVYLEDYKPSKPYGRRKSDIQEIKEEDVENIYVDEFSENKTDDPTNMFTKGTEDYSSVGRSMFKCKGCKGSNDYFINGLKYCNICGGQK